MSSPHQHQSSEKKATSPVSVLDCPKLTPEVKTYIGPIEGQQAGSSGSEIKSATDVGLGPDEKTPQLRPERTANLISGPGLVLDTAESKIVNPDEAKQPESVGLPSLEPGSAEIKQGQSAPIVEIKSTASAKPTS